MFSILVSAKDHFLTRYISARAKQLCGGREGGLSFFFLISTALSHAPRCRRTPRQAGRRISTTIYVQYCSRFLLLLLRFPKRFSEATAVTAQSNKQGPARVGEGPRGDGSRPTLGLRALDSASIGSEGHTQTRSAWGKRPPGMPTPPRTRTPTYIHT